MARIDDVFVSGTFGNIVFYRRMGKPCARIRRDHIKQTAATKKRGINFGIAARAGKGLRQGLVPAMPYPTDRSMQSRFSGAIAKWLGQSDVAALQPCDHLSYLSSFSFTEDDSFNTRFKIPYTVSLTESSAIINLASFNPVRNISAPAGTLSVHLVIAASATKLATGAPAGQAIQRVEIPYNNAEMPASTLSFEVPVFAGNMIVIAARLVYIGFKNNYNYIIEKKGFNPAAVIQAAYC